MSANKLPAADEESFCVKRRKIRSENPRRQAILSTAVASRGSGAGDARSFHRWSGGNRLFQQIQLDLDLLTDPLKGSEELRTQKQPH